MADFIVAEDADFDVAERIGGAARIGIVGEAVLRAEFAVDLIENNAEVRGAIGKKHGAASGFSNGL